MMSSDFTIFTDFKIQGVFEKSPIKGIGYISRTRKDTELISKETFGRYCVHFIEMKDFFEINTTISLKQNYSAELICKFPVWLMKSVIYVFLNSRKFMTTKKIVEQFHNFLIFEKLDSLLGNKIETLNNKS